MMLDKSCKEFIDVLSSAAPVPGGGGASAFVGTIGMALGSMVGSLTLGKKKYADVQEDIKVLLEKSDAIQKELIALVDKDAEVFEPLSKAYGLPKETDEQKAHKDKVMEEALDLACSVPMKIMEKALEAIKLHEEYAAKGTAIAISDVGVGVLFCKSALLGASLNVFINTKLMKDRNNAEVLNSRAERMIDEGTEKADKIYADVFAQIQR